MIFYLLVGMCLAFEIHKMLDFKTFARISYIINRYSKQISQSIGRRTPIFNSIRNLGYFNIVYLVIIIIGIFGSQSYFFAGLVWLALISGQLLKKVTNKLWFSIIYFTDSIISMMLLSLVLINYFFFKMEVFDFVKYLISLI